MHDAGDGAWAEVHLWDGRMNYLLFRKYMNPNPPGKGFSWKEVRLDLRAFANRKADLILKCYNDTGNNTVSDWLNWRDLALFTTTTP
jgi:hypothetical protein